MKTRLEEKGLQFMMKRRQWRNGSDWGRQAIPHSWCSQTNIVCMLGCFGGLWQSRPLSWAFCLLHVHSWHTGYTAGSTFHNYCTILQHKD